LITKKPQAELTLNSKACSPKEELVVNMVLQGKLSKEEAIGFLNYTPKILKDI